MRLRNWKLLFTSLLVLGLTACGSSKRDDSPDGGGEGIQEALSPEQAVLGEWKAPERSANGVTLRARFRILPDELHVSVICIKGLLRTRADISGPIEITATAIVSPEPLRNVRTIRRGDQTLDCEASINGGSTAYEVVDGQLYFDVGGQKTLVGEVKISRSRSVPGRRTGPRP